MTLTAQPVAEDTPISGKPRVGWSFYAWVYAVLMLGVTRVWNFSRPLNGDGELFAYVGRCWVHGIFPYKQIWDNKPPAIFALNGVAAMFHRQRMAIAVFDFAAFLIAIIFIDLILTELQCDKITRSIATFTAASIFVIPYYSATGNLTEIYILPFASICIYSFLRSARSVRFSWAWLLIAGASGGVAGAFKPPGIAGLLAITAFISVNIRGRKLTAFRNIFLLWLGAAIVWCGVGAYFAYYGAFRTMLDASLLYNLHYGSDPEHKSNPILAPLFIADRLSFVGCIWGGVALWFYLWARSVFHKATSDLLSSQQRKNAALLFLWMAADLCGAMAGGRYYPHYFLPVLLGMTIVFCIAIQVLMREFSSIRHSQIYLLALIIPIGVTGFRGQMEYYHSVVDDATVKIASFISEKKRPGDYLFTWLYAPGIYRMTGLYAPTRWESAHYIYDFPAAYNSVGPALIAQLYVTTPRFITYDCDEATKGNDSVKRHFLQLLEEKYRLAYRSGGTCVMMRNQVTASPDSVDRTVPVHPRDPQNRDQQSDDSMKR